MKLEIDLKKIGINTTKPRFTIGDVVRVRVTGVVANQENTIIATLIVGMVYDVPTGCWKYCLDLMTGKIWVEEFDLEEQTEDEDISLPESEEIGDGSIPF